MDKTSKIFGNEMSNRVIKKAERKKKKYREKFGDDSDKVYPIVIEENQTIGSKLGVQNLTIKEEVPSSQLDIYRGVIVGNINRGLGPYRVSMAIASAAHAMGYTPYFMDLNSFEQTTCTKVIDYQNKLYAKGFRISQQSHLFKKFFWKPMNSEGLKKLSFNAIDQKCAELMAPVFHEIPKEIPVIATHVSPAQAAIHAGMQKVVNMISDNWPMACHLAEGSLHTVQTHFAYQGYRTLNGMDKTRVLNPMNKEDIVCTGHYIDHEIVSNIPNDCARRVVRMKKGSSIRILLTIGGTDVQRDMYSTIIKFLLPFIQTKKVALYISIEDNFTTWGNLCSGIPKLEEAVTYFDEWDKTCTFAENAVEGEVSGIHVFYHKNIVESVYVTNLLMRSSDILVTRPSDLAFYPIPKLFIKRVDGYEMWGALHSAEIGDGTLEYSNIDHVIQMLELLLRDSTLVDQMCMNIIRNYEDGVYNGAYKVVELAMRRKSE